MKGFFKWFKKGAKMKRWMLVIVLGIALVSYGMVILLTEKELGIMELVKMIGSFVIGFTMAILGNVFMQKRTLELLVQETDTRDDAKEGQVKSLIFNKKVYDEGPKIVVIGGGSGLDSVLKGLKKYTSNITAIVTVSDYGEMATDSRKLLSTMPLDDVKNSLAALSEDDTVMDAILNYKFTEGKLKSLSFGDIYLLAMKELYGDFTVSVEQSSNVLNMTGKVLPVTLEPIDICAELEDGTVVQSKNKIPEMVAKKSSKVNRIYINPTNTVAAPGVLEAIQEADAIIIGPGSLYTNVIPNLLVRGVARTIKESKGFKIYISNIMTEPGQTDDYSLADHINAIQEHAGKGIVDYCIYDTGEIVPEFIRKYNEEGADLVEQDVSKAKDMGVKLLQRNLSYIDGEFIRHNPDAIASSIIELVCEDLKFRDMQNDAKYLMLNSRLKENKKHLRKTMKKDGKNGNTGTYNKNEERGKSKFAEKYNDRIKSIKESDEKSLKKKEAKLKQAAKKEKKNNETKIEKTTTTRKKSTATTVKPKTDEVNVTEVKRKRGRPRKVQE